MEADYDADVREHYRTVARQHGLSGQSTMMDHITREKETDAILAAARWAALEWTHTRPMRIVDAGCGNGTTLAALAAAGLPAALLGVELSDDLRALAQERFAGRDDVEVVAGDVRDPACLEPESVDLLVCQRVLINILDPAHQRQARDNITAALRSGGFAVFIEAFSESLRLLNEARTEFGLAAIGPAHHNLHLEEDFFETPLLEVCTPGQLGVPANFLSTHYYVSRVLFPALARSPDVPYNSHFVLTMSRLLSDAVGDYSPLRFLLFRRVPPDGGQGAAPGP